MKNIKNNYAQLLLLFFIQLGFVGYDIYNGLYFAINDDATMSAILGGRYGEPSEYMIFINVLVGKALKGLYQINNSISWLTVLYIFMYLASALMLDVVLIYSKKCERNKKIFGGIAITIAFIIMFSYFTFTEVAYWTFMATFIAFIANNEDLIESNGVRWFLWVSSSLLTLLGMLVRNDAIIGIVFVFLPYAFISFIRKKKWAVIVFLLVNGLCFISLKQIDKAICNNDIVQAEYNEWNTQRGKVYDFPPIEYEKTGLEEKSITKDQYEAIYNVFWYNREAVSKDVLYEVRQINAQNKNYNLNIYEIVKEVLNKISNIQYFHNFYYIFFVVSAFIYFISSKKKDALLYLVSPFLLEIVFYIIQRPMYRVIMPQYVFAVLILVIMYEYNGKSKRRELLVYLCMLLLLSLGVYQRYNKYLLFPSGEYLSTRREVVDYMNKEKDKCFMALDPYVFQCEVAVPAIDNYGIKTGNLLGNWEIFSKPHVELCNRLGISNPYDLFGESINNDNILFITTQGMNGLENHPYIQGLAEQYYGKDIKLELVDRITQTETEDWVVFKVVSE